MPVLCQIFIRTWLEKSVGMAIVTACALPVELCIAGTLSAGAGGECCGLF